MPHGLPSTHRVRSMRDTTFSAPAYTTITDSSPGGSSYSEILSSSGQTVFRTSGGETRGDRKNPTPYAFSKGISKNGRLTQTMYRMYQRAGTGSTIASYALVNPLQLVGRPSLWYDSGAGLLTPGSDRFSTDLAQAKDQAMEKIYDQIRGNSNMIVDLAEAGETMRMLKNVRALNSEFASAMTKIGSTRAARKLQRGQRLLDYTTSKWLEYRYGWSPLVHSIYDAFQTLMLKLDAIPVVVKARRTVSSERQIVLNSPGLSSSTSLLTSGTIKESTRVEYGIKFRPRSRKEIYDWTSLNPVGIAWELTPLSFVADWAVNIGEQLSLWENTILFADQFISGYETVGHRADVHWRESDSGNWPLVLDNEGWPINDNGFVYHQTNVASVDQEFRYKSRTLLGGLPRPGGLRVEVNLNAKRMLDATALFHGLVGKKVRAISLNP